MPEKQYIQALLADLTSKLAWVQDREIHSIFIGGGTPSLFQAASFDQLLNALTQHLRFSKDIEITLEANPGTVEQNRFQGFRRAGINRLSIGVQSLQNEKLQKLGRIHDASEALNAVAVAKNAGFERFNLDIMFGLPQQTIAQALADLNSAIALAPTHLSWYQLTLEPNTLFHRFPPTLPNDDLLWEMQCQGQQLLQHHNYQQYEISAYAKPDMQCQHNLNYWQFGDYIGIGAGAHSKVTTTTGEVLRAWNKKHPKSYLQTQADFIHEQVIIADHELPLEFMLNALRLCQPIEIALFTNRTGLPIESIEKAIAAAKANNFLTVNQQHLQTTAHGKQYLNECLELFMTS